MAIKIYKPTTPARRHTSVLASDDITASQPQKRLVISGQKMAGRNNQGKITVRHQGGGQRKKIRIIDYKRDKFDIPAKVASIEYDPGRNARIALLNYTDGEKRYIVAPIELKVGEKLMSSKKLIEFKAGNAMPLLVVPPGMFVYNVEMMPGKGGQLARSAGNAIYLMGLDGGHAQLKMPSGEIRLVSDKCLATIGSVSNQDYKNIRWGRAGRMRHKGIRPTVRGKAMNPVDHPHGGGEGNNPIGLKNPKTPWGKPALGVKTRRNNRISDQMIIARRHTKKRHK
ncbi:MAG: 50S ribosomal protein L2 [Candidatus Buchananbacteria bacterium RIFCSPHIGHO2_02_FULL_40_13]|uniref:Large ribosomal subunit protein uL2 n=1 Tax=Candidatus Buchananbacteria bacterium RIFCSPLOWO2_01_FULL_39_33 TaxID=1797543 RepID=A0A1G1YL32_9BACT|nr:MAG: 50S ribosomal protein L2 [Candidatus Buchananbacteria bacterium RIFCSPHIGHO2_01_FULL_40_35]OGY50571.1 MAG: 50S ribosomal protein L2 [Candidatus Buchananbacteria bacterium RIFCSPHIGHO2_02_FULL_40_13]OGY53042.1 MAG: 50S ribosomal protein L2 [Candidatus Buchananbacteria bacterium RIFCSPLOWO2_01_FULL_39_33]